MGHVTLRRNAEPECSCWQCTSVAFTPIRFEADQSALQSAVNTLGIREDVVVTACPIRYWGACAGWIDDGAWSVLVNDRDPRPDPEYDFSRTLWHELGHVLFFEKRIESGELVDGRHATAQMQREVAAQRSWSDYWNDPNERFARQVADRFGHIPLGHQVNVPTAGYAGGRRLGQLFTIPFA